jgi:hypothetical protein
MYSLGLLIAELESARRRLLNVFEVPSGVNAEETRSGNLPEIARALQHGNRAQA